jgi:enoyl-CoA hydratase/carnithine racemase
MSSAGQVPQLYIQNGCARILLRRPRQANRLGAEDLDELHRHLATVNADASVRVLVLQGEGKHFCAGFDLSSMGAVDAGAIFEALANAMEAARPITIARLHGGVYGGATDLALACDFRLGSPACEMFVPAARLGLHFYEGGLRRYVSRLGLSAAKRVLLAGETLDAGAMLASGFLDEIPVDLDARVETLVAELLAMAPLALLPMKQHLNAIAEGRLDPQRLAADIERARDSRDLSEGAAAWAEKRRPKFQGC